MIVDSPSPAGAQKAWLGDAQEVKLPMDEMHPLVVRRIELPAGPSSHTGPSLPEKHPYCEVVIQLQGKSMQFIGTEKIEQAAGSLTLIGPGIPHVTAFSTSPQRFITVHFLPKLLFELGPVGDGARLMARFTAPRKINERVVTPSANLSRELTARFEQIAREFHERKFGSEFRIWALLVNSLVELVRWEETSGFRLEQNSTSLNWVHVDNALRHIHAHYAEPLHLKGIASAVRLSTSRLKTTFREALGMGCMHYVRELRITRAKARLCEPGAQITETAYAVGFDGLGSFNAAFRHLVGMSPTEYIRSYRQQRH